MMTSAVVEAHLTWLAKLANRKLQGEWIYAGQAQRLVVTLWPEWYCITDGQYHEYHKDEDKAANTAVALFYNPLF